MGEHAAYLWAGTSSDRPGLGLVENSVQYLVDLCELVLVSSVPSSEAFKKSVDCKAIHEYLRMSRECRTRKVDAELMLDTRRRIQGT